MASRPAPSKKLLRAAQGEIERVQHARETAEAQRATLLAEIAQLDQTIKGYVHRIGLLNELIAEPTTPAPLLAVPRRITPSPQRTAISGTVRGRELRRVAGRLLWATERDGEIHYRDWFERAMTAGITIGGKDPAASFLTNIRDSPAVTRGSRPGYYRLDPHTLEKTKQQIRETQAELIDLQQTLELAPARDATDSQIDRLHTHLDQLTQLLKRLQRQAEELTYIFDEDQTTADPAVPPTRLAA